MTEWICLSCRENISKKKGIVQCNLQRRNNYLGNCPGCNYTECPDWKPKEALEMKKLICPFLTPHSQEDIVAIRYLIGIGALYVIIQKLLGGR